MTNMLIAIVCGCIYSVAAAATIFDRIDDIVDREYMNIMGGRPETPEWIMLIVAIMNLMCGLLWPVYWTGRVLYAIPERLALNPGEPQ